MESLKWNEQEQRTYAELFTVCDAENTGKISGLRASELFLTSGLQQDVLHQITELCGAKRLGHFGRSQFYIALKLIAAAQCGLPVSFDTFNKGFDIPVAKFGQQADIQQEYYSDRVSGMSGGHGHHPSGGLLPPPKTGRPGQLASRVIPGYDSHPATYDKTDSPQEPRSPPFSPKGSPPLSPPAEGHRAEVPVAGGHHQTVAGPHPYGPNYPNNNHVSNTHRMEKEWASFEDDSQGLISEESKQHQWAHFSDHNDPRGDTSSISSEAESVDEVWVITDEQREYYTKQFQAMQPDVTGVIVGAEAKEFFEKSRLPLHELAKIWQLSDVNHDGALSLDEFCIAMHLVVLRRNDIELPEDLPPALIPYVPLVNVNPEEPFAADLPPGSMKSLSPTSPQPTQWPPPSFPPESPDSSAVSSPGAKPAPVNFEFQPVNPADPDSKIIHPVPLRMSPEGHPLPGETEHIIQKPRAYSDGLISYTGPTLKTPAGSTLVEADEMNDAGDPPSLSGAAVTGRPRPMPFKAGGGRRSSQPPEHQGQGRLLPPPAKPPDPESGNLGNDGSAPPPPPRKGHSRSSSLDNQLLDSSDSKGSKSLMAPPAVPPRPSPKDGPVALKKLVSQTSEPIYGADPANFADFSQFQMSSSQEVLNGLPASRPEANKDAILVSTGTKNMSSSYTAYSGGPGIDSTDATGQDVDSQLATQHRERSGSKDIDKEDMEKSRKSKVLPKQESQDKKELQERVRRQRERNLTLERLSNELNQELQEVMEQRIALEIQLEHLRPYHS